MLLFKDIKPNYPVYIFDKQSMTVVQGKVNTISFPRLNNTDPMQMNPFNKAGMVVDVEIEADGKTATYAIPEGLAVTYSNNLVLSTERDGVVHEIEALKSNAESILATVDRQKEIIEKASGLLVSLDPVSKERQENELRMTNLEKSLELVKDSIVSIKEFLKQKNE